MSVGVEYRTIERYKGKPVYAMLVDFGVLPNNSNKYINTGISHSYSVISYQNAISGDIDGVYEFEMNSSYSTGLLYTSMTPRVSSSMATSPIHAAWHIYVNTGTNMSAYSMMSLVKYTK